MFPKYNNTLTQFTYFFKSKYIGFLQAIAKNVAINLLADVAWHTTRKKHYMQQCSILYTTAKYAICNFYI